MGLDVTPISAILDIGGKLIDRLWPDPAQRDAAKLQLFQMQQNGELAQLTADTSLAQGQISVDVAEASNDSIFVSGWRPFIGWVCGAALATQFLIAPLVTWVVMLYGRSIAFPPLDTGTLMTLLFGMLGLGGMRTAEKIQKIKAG